MEKVHEPQIVIRKASNDDLFKMRQMHAKSWLAVYPNDEAGISREWIEERVSNWTTPEGVEKSKERFKNVFGSPDHFYRIAEQGRAVVGLVHALREDGKQHLGALYIDETQYGTGLAQQLIDAALGWFDLSQSVELEVVSYNARAIRFYEKQGFNIVPDSEHLFDEKIPVVTMIRKADS